MLKLTDLKSIALKIGSGATPRGGKGAYKTSGISLIRSMNVYDAEFEYKDLAFIDDEQAQKLSNVEVQENDILLNITGASVARCCMVPAAILPARVNQHVAIIRINQEVASPEYVFLCLISPDYKNRLLALAQGGATREALTKTAIENFEIQLPSLDKQIEVAGIINSYSQLIENNNRRIEILETIAQKLYQEWFIHHRFPNHQQAQWQDTEQGKIPVGWEVKASSEVIEFAPRMRLPKEGLKPFVSMPNVSTSSMVIDEIEWREGNSGTKFQNGDTLLARITPCLQNGKTAFVQFLDEEHPIGLGSTEFIVMRSKTLTPEFVYCLARSAPFRGHAINSMAGADGRQRVKNDCFDTYYLTVPPQELLDDFSAVAEPLFKQVFALSKKNKNLKQQRDLLLPKLVR